MDQTGCSRTKDACSSKGASSKNREVAQADTRRNAKKGIRAWRIIGFARGRLILASATLWWKSWWPSSIRVLVSLKLYFPDGPSSERPIHKIRDCLALMLLRPSATRHSITDTDPDEGRLFRLLAALL